MKRVLTGVCLALLLSGPLNGQTPATPTSFELADVHVTAPGTASGGTYLPGRIEVHGATLLELISQAWQIDPDMVVGGPAWLNTNKYDVIAKTPAGTANFDSIGVMVQTLLAERFKLVVRKENRDQPVYVLTLGKKGRKLTPAAENEKQSTSKGTGDPALNNHVAFHAFTMAALADTFRDMARNFIDRPILDETGLKGSFDFQLDWMGKGVYAQAKANPDGPLAVSAFDAIENAGLKLEPAKRPQPVLVVESVLATPTPNAAGLNIPRPTFPTEFEVSELRSAKPGALEAALSKTGPGIAKQQLSSIGFMQLRNGEVEILSATLRGLVAIAYDQEDRRIAPTPKWMAEDRFDVIAKTDRAVPYDAIRVMLQNLLVERLNIAVHTEDQTLPVYVLLAGKKPKLKESDGTARSDCKVITTAVRPTWGCQNTTMAQFTELLPRIANAYIRPPLLDETGLAGAYDFELSWTPKRLLPGASGIGAADTSAATPTADLSVFEALDQQLGLKAEEQKRPVPLLVIDRANQTPSEK
jgi:uncharacterized protein (TIGR03435 family)